MHDWDTYSSYTVKEMLTPTHEWVKTMRGTAHNIFCSFYLDAVGAIFLLKLTL